jgi:hypothetical protein
LKRFLLAVCALLLAGATPALAAPTWVISGVHVASVGLPIHRLTSGLSTIIPGFLSAGPVESGLPCVGCVNSSSPGNTLGISLPNNYVTSGVDMNYVDNLTLLNYNGPCYFNITATSGSTVLFSGKAKVDLVSNASNSISVTATLNGYSGPALLTTKVFCDNASAVSTATLYFL